MPTEHRAEASTQRGRGRSPGSRPAAPGSYAKAFASARMRASPGRSGDASLGQMSCSPARGTSASPPRTSAAQGAPAYVRMSPRDATAPGSTAQSAQSTDASRDLAAERAPDPQVTADAHVPQQTDQAALASHSHAQDMLAAILQKQGLHTSELAGSASCPASQQDIARVAAALLEWASGRTPSAERSVLADVQSLLRVPCTPRGVRYLREELNKGHSTPVPKSRPCNKQDTSSPVSPRTERARQVNATREGFVTEETLAYSLHGKLLARPARRTLRERERGRRRARGQSAGPDCSPGIGRVFFPVIATSFRIEEQCAVATATTHRSGSSGTATPPATQSALSVTLNNASHTNLSMQPAANPLANATVSTVASSGHAAAPVGDGQTSKFVLGNRDVLVQASQSCADSAAAPQLNNSNNSSTNDTVTNTKQQRAKKDGPWWARLKQLFNDKQQPTSTASPTTGSGEKTKGVKLVSVATVAADDVAEATVGGVTDTQCDLLCGEASVAHMACDEPVQSISAPTHQLQGQDTVGVQTGIEIRPQCDMQFPQITFNTQCSSVAGPSTGLPTATATQAPYDAGVAHVPAPHQLQPLAYEDMLRTLQSVLLHGSTITGPSIPHKSGSKLGCVGTRKRPGVVVRGTDTVADVVRNRAVTQATLRCVRGGAVGKPRTRRAGPTGGAQAVGRAAAMPMRRPAGSSGGGAGKSKLLRAKARSNRVDKPCHTVDGCSFELPRWLIHSPRMMTYQPPWERSTHTYTPHSPTRAGTHSPKDICSPRGQYAATSPRSPRPSTGPARRATGTAPPAAAAPAAIAAVTRTCVSPPPGRAKATVGADKNGGGGAGQPKNMSWRPGGSPSPRGTYYDLKAPSTHTNEKPREGRSATGTPHARSRTASPTAHKQPQTTNAGPPTTTDAKQGGWPKAPASAPGLQYTGRNGTIVAATTETPTMQAPARRRRTASPLAHVTTSPSPPLPPRGTPDKKGMGATRGVEAVSPTRAVQAPAATVRGKAAAALSQGSYAARSRAQAAARSPAASSRHRPGSPSPTRPVQNLIMLPKAPHSAPTCHSSFTILASPSMDTPQPHPTEHTNTSPHAPASDSAAEKPRRRTAEIFVCPPDTQIPHFDVPRDAQGVEVGMLESVGDLGGEKGRSGGLKTGCPDKGLARDMSRVTQSLQWDEETMACGDEGRELTMDLRASLAVSVALAPPRALSVSSSLGGGMSGGGARQQPDAAAAAAAALLTPRRPGGDVCETPPASPTAAFLLLAKGRQRSPAVSSPLASALSGSPLRSGSRAPSSTLIMAALAPLEKRVPSGADHWSNDSLAHYESALLQVQECLALPDQ